MKDDKILYQANGQMGKSQIFDGPIQEEIPVIENEIMQRTSSQISEKQ